MSQLNPNLSQLYPYLSQLNPNLTQLYPNLTQLNPKLTQLYTKLLPLTGNHSVRKTVENITEPTSLTPEWPDYLGSQSFW